MPADPYTVAELDAAVARVDDLTDMTTDHYLTVEEEVRAALTAAAPLIAARAVEPYRRRIEALDALLACYRTGRQPSEALHRRLEQTRAALEGDQNA